MIIEKIYLDMDGELVEIAPTRQGAGSFIVHKDYLEVA